MGPFFSFYGILLTTAVDLWRSHPIRCGAKPSSALFPTEIASQSASEIGSFDGFDWLGGLDRVVEE